MPVRSSVAETRKSNGIIFTELVFHVHDWFIIVVFLSNVFLRFDGYDKAETGIGLLDVPYARS